MQLDTVHSLYMIATHILNLVGGMDGLRVHIIGMYYCDMVTQLHKTIVTENSAQHVAYHINVHW